MTENDILKQCTVEGATVKLPNVQLDRKTYQKVAKALQGIGGKWSRKEKGFVFDKDPTENLKLIQLGNKINLKKEFQFFETPFPVIEKMRNLISVEGLSVLEPSAGTGRLFDEIFKEDEDRKITFCELNEDRANDIIIKYRTDERISFGGYDFMKYPNVNKFNLIFANPPFTKGQYCDHIRKMYDHLNPNEDCQIITIAPVGFQTSQRGKEKKFREWLETIVIDYGIKDLPKGSFKESGTMVDTCILVIYNF